MPTLDDLHEAFAELERQAPTTVHARVRPHHRHRWVTVGLAAACTAAVAIAVPALTSDRRSNAPTGRAQGSPHVSATVEPKLLFGTPLPAPAPGESPALAYGFAIPDAPDGYTVIPDQITTTYQHASIYPQTDPPEGDVWVFYGGGFDPSSIDHSDPVTVGGQPGYYATVRIGTQGPAVTGLVWQYANDGWAVVHLDVTPVSDPGAKKYSNRAARLRAAERAQAERAERDAQARAGELQLAGGMVPAGSPVRSPVEVPTGVASAVQNISTSGIDGLDGGIDLTAAQGTWHLGWSPGQLTTSDKPDTSTTEIAGRQWIVYHDGDQLSLGLVADGWGMTIVSEPNVPSDQLEEFAASLQFAPDLTDQSTWFDAETALP